MTEPIRETVWTVARDGNAISSYVGSRESAEVDLARIQSAMRAAALEPDVTLATVVKTTTYGDPEPVKA
jgi:ATP-dependent Clp protease adapter protein ClpS